MAQLQWVFSWKLKLRKLKRNAEIKKLQNEDQLFMYLQSVCVKKVLSIVQDCQPCAWQFYLARSSCSGTNYGTFVDHAFKTFWQTLQCIVHEFVFKMKTTSLLVSMILKDVSYDMPLDRMSKIVSHISPVIIFLDAKILFATHTKLQV